MTTDYALILYGEEALGETPSVMSEEMGTAWERYWQELTEAGVEFLVTPLLPTGTARTVAGRGRTPPTVLDGPFAETKEQLGGVVILRGLPKSQAVEWASRMPCASHGTVEVRPLLQAGAG